MLNIQRGDILYRVNFERRDTIEEVPVVDVVMSEDGDSVKVWIDNEHTKYAWIRAKYEDYIEQGYVRPSTSRTYPDMLFTYKGLRQYIDNKLAEANKIIHKYELLQSKLIILNNIKGSYKYEM